MNWKPLALTVVGGLLTVAGGRSALRRRLTQQQSDQERRREQTSEVPAEITVLLKGIDPERFFFKISIPAWLEAVEPFVRRQEALRVLAHATRHPASNFRDLARG